MRAMRFMKMVMVLIPLLGIGMRAMAQTGAPTAGNSMQTGTDESLSSKLNKSDGVITPNTAVDPGIKVAPPVPSSVTKTPVIPPSATGGNSAK